MSAGDSHRVSDCVADCPPRSTVSSTPTQTDDGEAATLRRVTDLSRNCGGFRSVPSSRAITIENKEKSDEPGTMLSRADEVIE